MGTAQPHAGIGLRTYPAPDVLGGEEGKIIPAAAVGYFGPLLDGLQLALFLAEQGHLFDGVFQPTQTYVVAASLYQLRIDLLSEQLFGQGNIFIQQLLLKVDGSGRDNYPLAVLQCP